MSNEQTEVVKTVEITRPTVVRTMKQAKPEEYKKLKKLRRQRRQTKRAFLKSLGYKPNAKMTKCKRTDTVLSNGTKDIPSSIDITKLPRTSYAKPLPGAMSVGA